MNDNGPCLNWLCAIMRHNRYRMDPHLISSIYCIVEYIHLELINFFFGIFCVKLCRYFCFKFIVMMNEKSKRDLSYRFFYRRRYSPYRKQLIGVVKRCKLMDDIELDSKIMQIQQ